MEHIRKVAPDVIVIGDSKRGDIDSSMKAYYKAMFEAWDLDAMTVSPYLGKELDRPALHVRRKRHFHTLSHLKQKRW